MRETRQACFTVWSFMATTCIVHRKLWRKLTVASLLTKDTRKPQNIMHTCRVFRIMTYARAEEKNISENISRFSFLRQHKKSRILSVAPQNEQNFLFRFCVFFSGEKLEDNMMCVNFIKEGVQMRAFSAVFLSFLTLSFEDFYFSIYCQVFFFPFFSSRLCSSSEKGKEKLVLLPSTAFLWWHNAKKKRGKMLFNILVSGLLRVYDFQKTVNQTGKRNSA